MVSYKINPAYSVSLPIGMMNMDGLSGETVTTLDRIVHVACALINMCESVVYPLISMSFVHVHCNYVTEHCVCYQFRINLIAKLDVWDGNENSMASFAWD